MEEYLKLSQAERDELYQQFLKEPDAFYEKAEMDQLRTALSRNYTERFMTMTRLMKISIMLKNSTVVQPPVHKK